MPGIIKKQSVYNSKFRTVHEWLKSDEGISCTSMPTNKDFLISRLERAYSAGYESGNEDLILRINDLQRSINNLNLTIDYYEKALRECKNKSVK